MRRAFRHALQAAVFLAATTSLPALACDAVYAGKDMCQFVTVYHEEGSPTDPSILNRMGIEIPDAKVRSYAMIVDVNTYPNFDAADRELLPAKHDLANLEAFFKEQGFDEVIVLENDNASYDNIRYFLSNYLVSNSQAHGGLTRIVFAFSGHGAEGTPAGAPGALVLSSAYFASDPAGTLPLNELNSMLQTLGSHSYHLLALIGSCFSGGIFTGGVETGDNLSFSKQKGAHAVSATTSDQLAYGLSNDTGSLFFDSLIDGVESGWADPSYAGWVSDRDGGRLIRGGGIVRLSGLFGWISKKLEESTNPETGQSFPQIRIGAIKTAADPGGAFFFKVPLRDIRIAALGGPDDIGDDQQTVVLPASNTGSSISNRPDIKVFSAPDTYKVFGIDVSHHSEISDWQAIKNAGVRFAYMKATEGKTFKDDEFEDNWAGAAKAGIIHGAYHVFNFCRDADGQFDNLRSMVPIDPNAMPVAVDLEWYNGGPSIPSQKACTDLPKIRAQLQRLLGKITEYYGKPPIIYVHQSGVVPLLAGKFDNYALWLQNWEKDASAGPALAGHNPWTIWQFSGYGRLPGIENVDLNAFFGNEVEFAHFVNGGPNVAYVATLDKPVLPPHFWNAPVLVDLNQIMEAIEPVVPPLPFLQDAPEPPKAVGG